MDNNISFKANIITKMEGRHGIMKPIKRVFAKRTANLPGELHIFRDRNMYPDAIVISLNKEKDFILHDYADLLGNNIKSDKDISDKMVERIAATFVNIYKALAEDVKFDKFCETIGKEMQTLRKALKLNQSMSERCKATGDIANAEAFRYLVEQNNKKLQRLETACAYEKNLYLEKLDKMAKREPRLEVWRDVLTEHIENI